MLEAEHLIVSIGEKEILKDVSFVARPGECVAVIGPNGSGKSTLVRTLARILPYSGRILLDGAEARTISRRAYARRVALVSQFQNMAFDMNVLDMVLMGRTPYKSFLARDTAEDVARARGYLKAVGLEDFAERNLLALSGGERQRAVLARALNQETDILILDEATNHLDIYYQLEILSLIKRRQATAICVLHDVNLALAYADRLYALKDGKMLSPRRPEEVDPAWIRGLYGVEAVATMIPGTDTHQVLFPPQGL
ncbi:iron complex transport system ATP-binding protein [Peptoniphilus ivorii]|uniref:ABC transporter ATP-binding protein n=1 Tax=Aedoeadaptatus ivorii TaxID=54006 RepID=UPI00278AB3B8|nr:ABC transporter ATP-binding protein [Peptoniphilus ivorii]MDQ0507921.1 iron complex transport system ATP-binding protein [Peptoniphilus ivorii]